MIEHTDQEIKQHINDKTFVETNAIRRFMKSNGDNHTFMITGRAGMGKSRNGLEILRQLGHRCKDHELIKITEIGQVVEVLAKDKKMVLLLEDVFGKTNCKYNDDNDSHLLDKLQSYINSGNVKIIFTIRTSVRKSLQNMYLFSSHRIFQGFWEIDLNSIQFQMTNREKEQLILNYCQKNNIQIVGHCERENLEDENIIDKHIMVTVRQASIWEIVNTETFLGFPQACFLFTSNRFFTRLGVKFFKHPTVFLNNEIDNLRKKGHTHKQERILYITLVYTLLSNNYFEKFKFDAEKASNIMQSCFGKSERVIESRVHDAADEMVGGYLKYDVETSVYQLQHQTIFESVLLSYNKVDPKQVLAMVDFDMIREIVRLQMYKQKKEEIIMAVPEELYSSLSKRIVNIFLTQYKQTPIDFVKLLCECEIMRQSDHKFIHHLNVSFNDIVPQNAIQTLITYEGKSEMVVCNILAALLWHMTLNNWPSRNIQMVLDILKQDLRVENREVISNSCEKTIVAAFILSCENQNSPDKLDVFWNCIKEMGITFDINDSFRRVLDTNNSPSSSWLLLNLAIKINIVECILEVDKDGMNNLLHILASLFRCEPCDTLERDKIIHWVFSNSKADQFNVAEAISTICIRNKMGILDWMLARFSLSRTDITLLMEQACKNGWEKVVIWLMKNNDLDRFDLKSVMLSASERCWVDITKILLTKVNPKNVDVENAMKVACKKKKFGIISCVLANSDHTSINMRNTLETCFKQYQNDWDLSEFCTLLTDWLLSQSINFCADPHKKTNKQFIPDSLVALKWLLENNAGNPYKFRVEISDIILKRIEYLEDVLKWLLLNVDIQCIDLSLVMLELCRQRRCETVRWLQKHVSCKFLNLEKNLTESCEFRRFDVVKSLISNASHKFFDFTGAFRTLIKEEWKTQRNENQIIMKWLLENVKHDLFDVQTLMDEAFMRGCIEVIKLLLGTINNDCFDMKRLLENSCRHGYIEILHLVLVRVDNFTKHDMTIAVEKSSSPEVVKILLENVDIKLFDLSTVMKRAMLLDWSDILQFVVSNHQKDLRRIIKDVLLDAWIDDKSRKVVKVIIDSDSPALFDVQNVIDTACRCNWSDIVERVIKNFDQKHFSVTRAMTYVGNEKLLQLLLDNVSLDLYEVQQVLNKVCNNEWNDTLTWLFENKKLDIQTAMAGWDTNCFFLTQARKTRYDIFKLLLKNVRSGLYDEKVILKLACRYGCFETAEWLVKNIDPTKLDIQSAMEEMLTRHSRVFDDTILQNRILIIKLLCQYMCTSMLNVRVVMQLACLYGCFEIAEWLVKTIDHTTLDIQSAMEKMLIKLDDDSIFHNKIPILKLFCQNICASMLDACLLMKLACLYGCLEIAEMVVKTFDITLLCIEPELSKSPKKPEILTLLLHHIDPCCFDVNHILTDACFQADIKTVELLLKTVDHSMLNIDDFILNVIDEIGENGCAEEIIEIILLNNGSDLFDDVNDVMIWAISIGSIKIVKLLMKYFDHKKLEIQYAIEKAIDYVDDNDRLCQITRLLLQRVSTELLDVKVMMKFACCYGLSETVEWLLINVDHKKLGIRSVIETMLEGDVEQYKWIEIARLLLLNVSTELLEVQEVMKLACCFGWLEIVEWLVTNCIQFIDINIAVQSAFHAKSDIPSVDIIRYFLENVEHSLINIGYIMDEASHLGLSEIVRWLLEKIDNSIFDIKRVFDNACYHNDPNLVKWIYENHSIEKLDLRRAMNRACRYNTKNYSVKPLCTVEWLWDNFDHKLFDMENAMNNACRYGNTEIMEWIMGIVDTKAFDMNKVLNNSCRYGKIETVKLLIRIIETGRLDFQQAAKEACLSHNNDLEIIQFLVNTNDRPLLDVNRIIDEACKWCKTYIVEWLIQVTTCTESLNLNEAMKSILDIDVHVNTSDNRQVSANDSNKHQLVLTLLKRDHVAVNDINEVFLKSCANGWLNIVEWLWTNINTFLLDTKVGINLSCEYVRHNIVKWALQHVNTDMLDLKTIMIESCGYGWLGNVQWLWEKTDNTMFDMKSAVIEACTYCRLDVIKWIVATVDSEKYDITTVMYEACKSGWLDIVNWVIQHADRSKYNIHTTIRKSITYGHKQIVETLFKTFGKEYFLLPSLSLPLCSLSSHKDVVLFVLHNLDYNQLDMTAIMKKACWDGWTEVVEFVLRNVSHNKIEWKEPLLNTCTSGESQITTLLLDNIHHDKFDLKLALFFVCRHGWEEIASVLLDKVDHSKFDFQKAIGEASRCGEIDIIEIIFQKVDTEIFDVNSALKLLCTNSTNEDLIRWILTNVKVESFDYDSIREKACEYGWRTLAYELRNIHK